MKLIIPSALAAALVSPASATCANRGNTAASRIMDTNDCFPPPTGGASSDSNACNDLNLAESACFIYISQNYVAWCDYSSVSEREMKRKCWDEVQPKPLDEEDSGAEEEANFWEDSGDEEDEDAPVLAVDTANTYLRARDAPVLADTYLRTNTQGPGYCCQDLNSGSTWYQWGPCSSVYSGYGPVPCSSPPSQSEPDGCGKYTAGTAAAQAGVNIVNKLWLDSGKDCRYATRQFSSDVQSALNAEFPNNCRDTGAFEANASGVRSGQNYMNRIISDCSQPVPRPTRPPQTRGCSKGNPDYDQGVRITRNLKISCPFVDFADISIQEELAKINANNCVRRGAYAEFDKIKRGCGKSRKQKVLEME